MENKIIWPDGERFAPLDGKDDFARMAPADNGAWVKYTDCKILHRALEVIARGTKDDFPPFIAMGLYQAKEIAREALRLVKI